MARNDTYQTRAQRIAAKRDLLMHAIEEMGDAFQTATYRNHDAYFRARDRVVQYALDLYDAEHEPAQQRTRKGG